MPRPSRLTVRAGARLVCQDWGGPGPPLVLLHGLAGHAGEWDAVAHRLRRRYRVITFDQRGHGDSQRYPGDVSRGAYVADLLAVIDQLGVPRPVLIGQSLGGHTAMLAAAAHPEQVRGLVLIDAGPAGPNPNAPARLRRWLESWPVPFASREAAVAFFGGGVLGAGWADGLEERAGQWWPRFDPEVMVASLAENAQRGFWHEWRQLRCPTLLVLAQTTFLAAQEVDQMLRQQPETVALCVRGTGHDLHLEQPEVLAHAISSFLTNLT